MRVFIGMETSGALRQRFQALGHDVISCDLLPAEDNGAGHIQGDVFQVLDDLWPCWWPDLAVFHPTCTYLTNSAAWAFGDGPYHQNVKPGTLVGAARRAARDAALNDVRKIIHLPIRRKVIENPIGAIGTAVAKPHQIIQPYQFGDDASKATCLWFFDKHAAPALELRLPIDPAKRVAGRIVNGRERWSNQTDSGQNRLSPGEDRWKERSRTYSGIADTMAFHFSRVSVLTNDNEGIFS
ncbi:hypothetical protein [Rhizobium phaseoli]|uniref:hypothetical protein n=1 Tax=Rhizobium phaseoli TaxID=396 RepID=UPI00255573AF|nr:hypothetical protein [Rhizobium phaseoli]MDK4730528.1 hypothetical protein [Rhizobium phaseoli]